MAAIRAGQGLLVGLLRGGRGTHARYLCKRDYDDGGQYLIGD
jgi:hypothetical protein